VYVWVRVNQIFIRGIGRQDENLKLAANYVLPLSFSLATGTAFSLTIGKIFL